MLELVDTNAYKLQPSLSERVVVDGHGCHTALHSGVIAKDNPRQSSYVVLVTLTPQKNLQSKTYC